MTREEAEKLAYNALPAIALVQVGVLRAVTDLLLLVHAQGLEEAARECIRWAEADKRGAHASAAGGRCADAIRALVSAERDGSRLPPARWYLR